MINNLTNYIMNDYGIVEDVMIESINENIDKEDISSLYSYIEEQKKLSKEDPVPEGERAFIYTDDLLSQISCKLLLSKYSEPTITRNGFSNFKPFGEQEQMFSKKPITLIYGPNSIGKSSVMNALLYLQYFQKKGEFSLISTNMFGDTLDLGGFQKCIHQRDNSKTMSFTVEVDDCRGALLKSSGLSDAQVDTISYLSNFTDDTKTIKKMHFLSKVIFLEAIKDYSSKFTDETFSLEKLFQERIEYPLDLGLVNSNGEAYELLDSHYLVRVLNEILIATLKNYIIIWIAEENNNKALGNLQKDRLYNCVLGKTENIFPIEKITKQVITRIQEKFLPENFQKNAIELYSSRKKLTVVYELSANETIKKYFIDSKLMFSNSQDNTGFLSRYLNKIKSYGESELLLLMKDVDNSDILKELDKIVIAKQAQYIGPLRFYPERGFSFTEADNDKNVMPNSQESWTLLKRDSELVKKVNKWLLEDSKLKTPYEIKYSKLYNIDSVLKDIDLESLGSEELVELLKQNSDFKEEMVFEDKRSNTQVSNRDLGLGISQVLPILISTNRNSNKMIAIEQPELHLHPAVQAELADEFIRSYKEQGNEFIIETHSEDLLLRIMRRMRYTAQGGESLLENNDSIINEDKTFDLTPDDICILYVDSDSKSTYIQELRLSGKGTLLDHWPNGFFEEGYKERFS